MERKVKRWCAAAFGLLAGAASFVVAPDVAGAAEAISISGRVLWTHADGGQHAATGAPVQVWDADLGRHGLLAEVMTDADGYWAAMVDPLPEGAERRLYARAECRWAFGYLKAPGGAIHSLRSPEELLSAGESARFDLSAGNELDNDTCFSVREALSRMSDYYAGLKGSDPTFLRVVYPTDARTSMFFQFRLHILQLDRWDWDVILHEYGHWVADQHAIDLSPGGDHGTQENLAEQKDAWGNILGKDMGIRLAWSEGFATYLSISAQRAMGLHRLGIPNVGDPIYSDTEDLNFEYSLKPAEGVGEDNELTVSSLLYDVFDGVTRGEGDEVALGDRAIWDALTKAKATTLSTAVSALLDGRPLAEQVAIGAVAARHGVAPRLLPPQVADDAPATFRWLPNGGGPEFRNNRFVVSFYDAQMQPLFETKVTSATTYTPTPEQWQILKSAAGPVHWAVTGRSVAAPATGPYPSGAGQIAW